MSARRGAAGRRGSEVRSDAWIEVELREAGGIELALRSRVDAYYGESIRRQVREGLARCGVEHARVELEDQGALPFVLDARLEAAARRAGARIVDERGFPARAPAPRERLRRSRLYL
ncbi:MAG TPA: hypothetical protein VJS92_05530, partial [Candidatus Polarisedimenticolaceae bacterium]|nr:hypothetical protein [Candidatus Polarisedimenticolaceae bacterium]